MASLLDGLAAEAYDRNYGDGQLVKRTLRYFRPKFRIIVIITILVVLNSLMDLALPVLIAQVLDKITVAQTFVPIGILIVAILVSGVFAWIFNFFRQWYTAEAVADVVLDVRQDAIAAVVAHDLSFFNDHTSGKIVSRLSSDTEDFSTVVTLTLNVLSQVLLFLLMTGLLFYRNVQLALITLAIVPIIVLISLGFRHIARRTTQRAQRALARVNSNFQEAMSGITIAKNFRQEPMMYRDFRKINEQRYQVTLRSGFVYNGIYPILTTVADIGTVLIVYLGSRYVIEGTVSAGDWFLFVQSISTFLIPLTSVAAFWSLFQQGLSASERIFALIDVKPTVSQIAQNPIPVLEGNITFRDVSFSYRKGEVVLPCFSLSISRGEKLAIVGHTGTGKSSIVRLIMRFYEFQQGQLLIDGQDIRHLDLASYRRHIGFVPQMPFLFSGTIAENIRYGRPDATDADVEWAAVQVGGEWLHGLREGLASDVGERGARLSLGQRQLVVLARVLLQNPSIFILDEATASVDPFTEAQIQKALDRVMLGRTSIIIAHRLSTIESADRIIVMEAGQVVEEGSHCNLLARDAHYAQLYNTYFRHQSSEYIEHFGS